jgi:nucleolar protein 53
MSVVRKNKRATKGTKNWRKNIDVTGLEHEIEAKKDQEKLENEVRRKLKEQPLFFIDKKPDGPAQRTPLAADRFKQKPREHTETEARTISKLVAKAQRKAEERNQKNNASVNKKNADDDLWADEEPITSRTVGKGQGPAVLPPHEGQSYNPSYKSHKDLLQKVVEEETLKDRAENQVIEIERQRYSDIHVPKLIKSVKERKEAREKWQRKVEKKIEHDLLYLKKIKKEIEVEDQEKKKKLEERAKEEAEEERLAAEGKIIRTKRVNRNLYHHPGTDFQLTSELKPNLRTIKVTGSLARDRFDSIFRRNLIEKTGYEKKKKNKGSKHPKFKFHTTERGKPEDDDTFKVHK